MNRVTDNPQSSDHTSNIRAIPRHCLLKLVLSEPPSGSFTSAPVALSAIALCDPSSDKRLDSAVSLLAALKSASSRADFHDDLFIDVCMALKLESEPVLRRIMIDILCELASLGCSIEPFESRIRELLKDPDPGVAMGTTSIITSALSDYRDIEPVHQNINQSIFEVFSLYITLSPCDLKVSLFNCIAHFINFGLEEATHIKSLCALHPHNDAAIFLDGLCDVAIKHHSGLSANDHY